VDSSATRVVNRSYDIAARGVNHNRGRARPIIAEPDDADLVIPATQFGLRDLTSSAPLGIPLCRSSCEHRLQQPSPVDTFRSWGEPLSSPRSAACLRSRLGSRPPSLGSAFSQVPTGRSVLRSDRPQFL